jgi:NAD(P)-dependent dehydrogenase (short-subunit alcohol dehydrogenase family)
VINSVLVTGASTGLGRETAIHLAERGYPVYASMLNLAERSALDGAREQGLDIRPIELDIRDPASIARAIDLIVAETGGLYALVNSAGTRLRGCFEDLREDEIRKLFETNLFGMMALTRAVLPPMRKARRGKIVLVTSIAGRIGSFGVGAYCASKFAQEGFGESLAQEVKPFGIDVALIEPGIIRTEAWSVNRVTGAAALNAASPYAAWFRRAEELADRMVRSSPTLPRDVAEAIFLTLSTPATRLRRVVGRRARMVLAMRRCLPAALFERVYFGQLMRIVTAPGTDDGHSPSTGRRARPAGISDDPGRTAG